MKAIGKKSGLNPTVIQAFKSEIEIFLDQAITYDLLLPVGRRSKKYS